MSDAEYEHAGEWDGRVDEDDDSGDLFIEGLQVVEIDDDAGTYMTEDGTIWAPPGSPLAEDYAYDDDDDVEEYEDDDEPESEYFDPEYEPPQTTAQRAEAFAEQLRGEGATISQIRRDIGRELTTREANALGHELLEQFDRGERLDASEAMASAIYFEGVTPRDMDNHADRVEHMVERFEDAQPKPSGLTEDQLASAERVLSEEVPVDENGRPDFDRSREDRLAYYDARLSGEVAVNDEGDDWAPVQTREDDDVDHEDLSSHHARMEHYGRALDFDA